ncbi:MAG: tetratricopeptide repeat protein [Thermoguttaceae bacterium]
MSKSKKSFNKQAPQARSGMAVPPGLPLVVMAGVAIIAAAAFIAYLPSLNGGFIWDDYLLLVDNPLIQASDGLYRIWCTSEAEEYYPVTNTSLWIQWRLLGMDHAGYHHTSLILHIVEALLIWLILRKLSIPGAFLAAVIFAVHPVNVEAVAWIAQRKDMMAMLFFLLSILCYLNFLKRAPRPTFGWCPVAAKQVNRVAVNQSQSTIQFKAHAFSSFILHPSSFCLWYWLSLGAFLLAMLSKGSVAVLPVVLLGIVWWQRTGGKYEAEGDSPIFSTRKLGQSPISKWDLVLSAPFFAIAVGLTCVNVWFQTHGTEKVFRDAGFAERLMGAGGVVWFYLYKAFFPVDLAFVYRQWHIEAGNLLWWLPLLAALIVTAVLWLYKESWSRGVLFAWGFFCVALAPAMGLVDVQFMQYSLVADRYQHIAIVGVIALASALWSLWLWRVRGGMRSAAIAVAVAAVGALMFLTLRQSSLYRDAMTLYEATLAKNPNCVMAQFNYANALSKMNRLEEAVDHYRQALRLDPDFVMVYYNLGSTLLQMGRSQEAIEHFQEFLRRKPNQAEVHNGLASALACLGRNNEAMEEYEEALRLKPDLLSARCNLGNLLIQEMRPWEAIEHFQYALQLQPEYLEACANLGVALAQTGRLPEAVDFFRRVLLVKPNDAETHKNLGNALMQTGRPHEAIEHFKQAVQIKPDYIGAYNLLAVAYASVNQSSQAVAAAQKALDLARSQGQTALAGQIEDWLNSYHGQTPSSKVQNKDQ